MKTFEEFLNKYTETRKKLKAFNFAFALVGFDSETVAPRDCFEARGDNLAVLSSLEYEIQTDKEYVEAINYLFENKDKLDKVMAHEIVESKKNIDRTLKIPVEEIMYGTKLFASSQHIWANARKENDYSKFEKTLSDIIEYEKRYINYIKTDDLYGYDVLLDSFEPGMRQKDYDLFFDTLKEKLVPFVKKVLAKGNNFDDSFNQNTFPAYKQKEICEYFRDVMCFDKNKGIMSESEHPFTNKMGPNDIRITVHYYENMVLSSIFSCIHETGHAMYEAQVDEKLEETFMASGASMALHESQSRFFENVVARSEAFWKKHFSKLQEVYSEELKGVKLEDFVKEVNKVEASYIRTEADELTYPLHIMLRYDIEKKLLDGSLSVKDAKDYWNKLFYEYFGIEVKNDSDGILQDIHWSMGSIGYFPTYALGSAYAAQFLNAMKKDLDFDKEVGSDNLKNINNWLKEHIHKYGASLYPKEIIKIATGEDFNPNYYVDYLINKYKKIYDIE